MMTSLSKMRPGGICNIIMAAIWWTQLSRQQRCWMMTAGRNWLRFMYDLKSRFANSLKLICSMIGLVLYSVQAAIKFDVCVSGHMGSDGACMCVAVEL